MQFVPDFADEFMAVLGVVRGLDAFWRCAVDHCLPFDLPMSSSPWLTRVWRWLTRAYHYEFEVVRPFDAVATISGTPRRFNPGERVLCHSAPDDTRTMFEFESNFFMVERTMFEACCKARKPTTMPS
jgi:hypothetical protein